LSFWLGRGVCVGCWDACLGSWFVGACGAIVACVRCWFVGCFLVGGMGGGVVLPGFIAGSEGVFHELGRERFGMFGLCGVLVWFCRGFSVGPGVGCFCLGGWFVSPGLFWRVGGRFLCGVSGCRWRLVCEYLCGLTMWFWTVLVGGGGFLRCGRWLVWVCCVVCRDVGWYLVGGVRGFFVAVVYVLFDYFFGVGCFCGCLGWDVWVGVGFCSFRGVFLLAWVFVHCLWCGIWIFERVSLGCFGWCVTVMCPFRGLVVLWVFHLVGVGWVVSTMLLRLTGCGFVGVLGGGVCAWCGDGVRWWGRCLGAVRGVCVTTGVLFVGGLCRLGVRGGWGCVCHWVAGGLSCCSCCSRGTLRCVSRFERCFASVVRTLLVLAGSQRVAVLAWRKQWVIGRGGGGWSGRPWGRLWGGRIGWVEAPCVVVAVPSPRLRFWGWGLVCVVVWFSCGVLGTS